MQMLKQSFDFYLNSSIHVALNAVALSWVTGITFHLPVDGAVLWFVFFASVTGYNFVKYSGLAKFHHRQLANWLRAIQVFSLFCFVAMLVCFFKLRSQTWWYVLGVAAMTFLYAVPFLPQKYVLDKHGNLRNIGGLKVYIIALVWAVVTVVLPLVNGRYIFDFDCLITLVQRFVFVLVLMLPFEIRDLQFDSLKLATIPQRIGVLKTKVLGSLSLVVFCLLEFVKDDVSFRLVVPMLVISVITLGFLWFSKGNQGRYYCAFWVEGIPMMWLLLLLF
ncbi:MAG: hypothetical protein GYB39_06550 [Algicola sp.]|nr:hypothetical protein [Algicola sp.]